MNPTAALKDAPEPDLKPTPEASVLLLWWEDEPAGPYAPGAVVRLMLTYRTPQGHYRSMARTRRAESAPLSARYRARHETGGALELKLERVGVFQIDGPALPHPRFAGVHCLRMPTDAGRELADALDLMAW